MRRSSTLAAAIGVAALALPVRVEAHRLDEYLQATRLSLGVDTVRVEMDLSPGVAVAGAVIAAIDANGDGRVADEEAAAYAATILGGVRLAVDDRPVALRVERQRVPPIADMAEGIGTIRLLATAPVVTDGGHHRLTFDNANAPGISVYLVNAMTPSDRRITLASQRRDVFQRTFALDYDVAGGATWLGWSGVAIALIGMLVAGRGGNRVRGDDFTRRSTGCTDAGEAASAETISCRNRRGEGTGEQRARRRVHAEIAEVQGTQRFKRF